MKTREILSFKKIRNRLLNQKKIIENRYNTGLLKIYESEKQKTLKALVSKASSKEGKLKIIKCSANKDALHQSKTLVSSISRLGANTYKAFLNKERLLLKSS